MISEDMDWMWRSNDDEFINLKGMYYTKKLTVQCGKFLFLGIQYARMVRYDFQFVFFVELEEDSA